MFLEPVPEVLNHTSILLFIQSKIQHMTFASLRNWWSDSGKLFVRRVTASNFFSGLLLVMSSWGLYFAYLWPQMLYYDETGVQAGWIGVWGDWAAHIIYAAVFAFRPVEMWLSPHPLHINSPFTYPFLADALSGVLMRFGVDMIDAFVYPSLFTSLFFLGVIYGFYYYFTHKGSAAFVALTLFLLNGGMGFWWFLKDFAMNPSVEMLAYPPLEYTHLKDQPIEWISIVTSEMIPQRSFLLGLPIVVLVVLRLYTWFTQRFHTVKWQHLAALGLLSGTLIFVHAHSFIVLFLICAVLGILSLKNWKSWAVYGFFTGLIAVPIFLWLHAENAGGFLSFLPGWLANPKEKDVNLLYFWWLNYGVFLPTALFGTIRYRLYKNPLVMIGWFLFILANLVKFQPWPWDNTKIFTWSHLFLVLPVLEVLHDLWKRTVALKVVVVGLFLILTLSSWLDVWRFTRVDRNSYQMWSYDDLMIAEAFNSLAEPGDRVLTGQNHNSWVAAHTEGQVLLGFPGWLWTYGVTDPELSDDIYRMFAGGTEAEELLRKYDVRYVVIGGPERVDMRANELYFSNRFRLVLQNGEYNVYQTDFR